MWAIAVKEFRQIRRDHRMLGLMVFMPLLMLVIFGYAASFDVDRVETLAVGPGAAEAAGGLPGTFEVVDSRAGGRDEAVTALRRGEAAVALVAEAGGPPLLLVDGSQLFAARSALQALAPGGPGGAPARDTSAAGPEGLRPEVLFNPGLETSTIMVPGLMGIVLVFVGVLMTSLGIVRERQAGTLEQLAVMPFRPRDVIAGKVLPYFAIAVFDMTVIVIAGLTLFDLPFVGSFWVFALASALFLLVTLGMGVLISTVSENQGQAVMLALMTLLPQVLLSGLIFPIEAMAAGVRWIAYVLPLSYFIQVARGVLIRGTPLDALWLPIGMLGLLGVVVFSLSILRFRRDLAPRAARPGAGGPAPATPESAVREAAR
jgi:ABC-2 type transport system permease protein